MGTLTADTPSLSEHCPHKLPSSCRLTATPLCCACQDKRAHAPSYSVYIDGVGFVPRGTRWQRYCWFCKEFWENRVAACDPPLRPSQTRIPEEPDQTEFLQRWFEFHRGYRIIKREDGTEERIAVLGEPLKEAAPGTLPRTLDELRAGAASSTRGTLIRQSAMNEISQTAEQASESLEAVLEQLYDAATAEDDAQSLPSLAETEPPSPPLVTQLTTRTTSADPVAVNEGSTHNPEAQQSHVDRLRSAGHRALRQSAGSYSDETSTGRQGAGMQEQRERLDRLQERLAEITESLTRPGSGVGAGVSADQGQHISEVAASITNQAHGLHSLEAQLRDLDRRLNQINRTMGLTARERRREFNHRLEELQRRSSVNTASSIAPRLEEARQRLIEALAARVDAATELQASESEVQVCREEVRRLEREQRTIENYTRLFGTREEMERQGADYESPIGGMFNRAWERYRTAEEVRREERTLREVLDGEDRVVDEAEARWYTHIPNPDVERTAGGNFADEETDEENLEVLAWEQTPGTSNSFHPTLWRQELNSILADGETPPTESHTRGGEEGVGARESPPTRSHPPLGTRAGSSVSAWRQDIDLLNARQRHLLEVARQADPRLRSILPTGTTNPPLPALGSTSTSTSTPIATATATTTSPPTEGSMQHRPYPLPRPNFLLRPRTLGPPPLSRGIGLDTPGSSRPPPLEEHELMVKLECKVCYSQLADTAVLPCGHCVMCRWCADVAMPVVEGDASGMRLRGSGVRCAVCRGKVRRRIRILT